MSEPLFISNQAEMPEIPSGNDRAVKDIKVTFKNIVWPLLLSLVVLLLIGYFTFDAETFRRTLSSLNEWYIVAAVGTIFLRVIFGAWRFSYISRGQLGFIKGLRGQLAWDFFSNVTPAALGGGPFAALYVAKDSKMQVGETTALVLFTILLDQFWSALMIPFILVSALYIAVIPPEIGSFGTLAVIGYFIAMLSWVGVFGYATLFKPELIERLSDRVFSISFLKRFRSRVAKEMNKMSECARMLRAQPPSFFTNAFLLTAATWIPRYLLPVFIVLSVFEGLDSFLFFLRGITMTVSSFIVPTPGGAGGIEGLYVIFLGPMMPTALVAPTLFMWRFFGYYIFVALGAFLFYKGKQRTKKTAADKETTNPPVKNFPYPSQEPEPEFADSKD
ncbi:MAG: lysylphosphatidylglycerol synthase transmembrane domain-containing protein [Rhodothermales bacterium]